MELRRIVRPLPARRKRRSCRRHWRRRPRTCPGCSRRLRHRRRTLHRRRRRLLRLLKRQPHHLPQLPGHRSQTIRRRMLLRISSWHRARLIRQVRPRRLQARRRLWRQQRKRARCFKPHRHRFRHRVRMIRIAIDLRRAQHLPRKQPRRKRLRTRNAIRRWEAVTVRCPRRTHLLRPRHLLPPRRLRAHRNTRRQLLRLPAAVLEAAMV